MQKKFQLIVGDCPPWGLSPTNYTSPNATSAQPFNFKHEIKKQISNEILESKVLTEINLAHSLVGRNFLGKSVRNYLAAGQNISTVAAA